MKKMYLISDELMVAFRESGKHFLVHYVEKGENLSIILDPYKFPICRHRTKLLETLRWIQRCDTDVIYEKKYDSYSLCVECYKVKGSGEEKKETETCEDIPAKIFTIGERKNIVKMALETTIMVTDRTQPLFSFEEPKKTLKEIENINSNVQMLVEEMNKKIESEKGEFVTKPSESSSLQKIYMTISMLHREEVLLFSDPNSKWIKDSTEAEIKDLLATNLFFFEMVKEYIKIHKSWRTSSKGKEELDEAEKILLLAFCHVIQKLVKVDDTLKQRPAFQWAKIICDNVQSEIFEMAKKKLEEFTRKKREKPTIKRWASAIKSTTQSIVIYAKVVGDWFLRTSIFLWQHRVAIFFILAIIHGVGPLILFTQMGEWTLTNILGSIASSICKLGVPFVIYRYGWKCATEIARYLMMLGPFSNITTLFNNRFGNFIVGVGQTVTTLAIYNLVKYMIYYILMTLCNVMSISTKPLFIFVKIIKLHYVEGQPIDEAIAPLKDYIKESFSHYLATEKEKIINEISYLSDAILETVVNSVHSVQMSVPEQIEHAKQYFSSEFFTVSRSVKDWLGSYWEYNNPETRALLQNIYCYENPATACDIYDPFGSLALPPKEQFAANVDLIGKIAEYTRDALRFLLEKSGPIMEFIKRSTRFIGESTQQILNGIKCALQYFKDKYQTIIDWLLKYDIFINYAMSFVEMVFTKWTHEETQISIVFKQQLAQIEKDLEERLLGISEEEIEYVIYQILQQKEERRKKRRKEEEEEEEGEGEKRRREEQ